MTINVSYPRSHASTALVAVRSMGSAYMFGMKRQTVKQQTVNRYIPFASLREGQPKKEKTPGL